MALFNDGYIWKKHQRGRTRWNGFFRAGMGKHLTDRVKTAARYDTEIEVSADYRPSYKATKRDVWQGIASIDTITKENARSVAYALNELYQYEMDDFQRRF